MVIHQSEAPAVLLFAGQGNPAIGMGADLWDLNATTKRIWDCSSDITGLDVRRLCLKGPMTRLVQTTVQQVAVTAINVTLHALCAGKLADMQIAGSCGHSVGEYSALYAAGAMPLETLFRTIHARACIMHELSNTHRGVMVAVKGADYPTIGALLADAGLPVDISCDNSPRQQVIGGEAEEISEAMRLLRDAGFEAVKLGVSGAWHTRLMSDGVQKMRDVLADVAIRCPDHAVLMNVTGQAGYDPAHIKENLALHLTHTVKWTDSMTAFLRHSPAVRFIEMSSKAFLGQMLNDFDRFTPNAAVHCRTLAGI